MFALTALLVLVAAPSPPPSPLPSTSPPTSASISPRTSPSPAAAATPIPDPCGSIISLVTRPTVATSACTLRPHHVIAENGWSNTITTGPGGGATTSYAQTFIHWGTWDPHLEFTLTPPSWNRSTVGGALVDGTSDVNVGAKYELGYTEKVVWGVGGQVSYPTGDRAFTGGGQGYTGDFNWSYTLNSIYSIGATASFNSLTGFDSHNNVGRFSTFIPSVVLSAGLPVNSQAYVEYAYFSHAGLGLGGKSLIDFGLIRDFTPNAQFDVEYGYSPTVILGQKQHYVGVGLSFMN